MKLYLMVIVLVLISGCNTYKPYLCDANPNCTFDKHIGTQFQCCDKSQCQMNFTFPIYEAMSICPTGTQYKSVECGCAKNTTTPCMVQCFICEKKMYEIDRSLTKENITDFLNNKTEVSE